MTIVLITCDFIAIGAAFWFAYQVRFTILPYQAPYSEAEYRLLVFSIIPIWLLIFAAFGLYNPNTLLGGLQEYSRVFNAITAGILALILLGFFRRDDCLLGGLERRHSSLPIFFFTSKGTSRVTAGNDGWPRS